MDRMELGVNRSGLARMRKEHFGVGGHVTAQDGSGCVITAAGVQQRRVISNEIMGGAEWRKRMVMDGERGGGRNSRVTPSQEETLGRGGSFDAGSWNRAGKRDCPMPGKPAALE